MIAMIARVSAALVLLTSVAWGQSPPFPQSLPSNTVVGNISPVAGPARAVSLQALSAAITGTIAGGTVIGNPTTSPTFGAPTANPVLGLAGTATGSLGLSGTTSGTVTISPQPAAGTYNFLLPTAAGTANQVLTSQGGSAAQTYQNIASLLTAGTGMSITGTTNATVNLNYALVADNLAARFGSMDVWQRGAGGSASIAVGSSTTAYTVDGCYLAAGLGEASTVAAVSGIAAGSFKAAAITRNSGQTGTPAMVFGCPFDTDEVALFAGQFVTLSFTASTGANWSPTSGNLTYELFCGTGTPKKQTTGYTGQTTPINTTVAIPAGTAAARYQSTSAAIVPANCTQAEIQWNWTPTGTAGAADTVTIDDVQIEVVGSSSGIAAPYQRLPFAEQLHLAQRHFTKTFPYGTAPAQNAGVTGSLSNISQVITTPAISMPWRFPRQLRANPTITTFNPSAANANCRDATGSVDLTATVDATNAASGDQVDISCAAAATVSHFIYLQVTADAGI